MYNCIFVAFWGPGTRGRFSENQTFLSQNPFPVQTSAIPVSPGLRQHSGPVSLGACCWLRPQSPRENWGQRDGSGELSEWAEPPAPRGCMWTMCLVGHVGASAWVTSFGWPVVCCVCVLIRMFLFCGCLITCFWPWTSV